MKKIERWIGRVLFFIMIFTVVPIGLRDSIQLTAAGEIIELPNLLSNGQVPEDYTDLQRKSTVSGRTWVDYGGRVHEFDGNIHVVETPDPTGERDVLLPNTPIYFQWMDEDGTVSPVYKTVSNDLGAYMFSPGSYTTTSATGIETVHTFMEYKSGFEVNPYPKIKMWTDDQWASGQNLNLVADTSEGNFVGLFDNPTPESATWKKDVLNTQIINTALVFQYRDDLTLHKPAGQRIIQTTPTSDINSNTTAVTNNDFRGNVFWDMGYTQIIGDTARYNSSEGDLYAKDITVLLSISDLNGNIIQTYETKTNAYGDFQFNLNDLRQRRLAFGIDVLMYLSVVAPDNVSVWKNAPVTTFSATGPSGSSGGYSWTGVYGESRVSPDGIVPNRYDASLYGYHDTILNFTNSAGAGFQFILSPQHTSFEVTPYDDLSNYAKPGDTAIAGGTGYVPDVGITYDIVWKDDTGQEVFRNNNVTVNPDGSLNTSSFTVPPALNRETLYRAELQNAVDGRVIAVDHFIATPYPGPPISVRIILDQNDDGIIDYTEKGTATETPVEIGLPDNIKVGDRVLVDTNNDGTFETTIVVSQEDINNQKVTINVPLPPDGETIKVNAKTAPPTGEGIATVVSDEAYMERETTIPVAKPDDPTPEGYIRVILYPGDHGHLTPAPGTTLQPDGSILLDVKKDTAILEKYLPTINPSLGYKENGWDPSITTPVTESINIFTGQYILLKGSLEVTKTGTDNIPLSGAEFQLTGTTLTGKTVTYPLEGTLLTSDPDGKLIFTEVEFGDYVLTEVSAPEGYTKAQDIEVKIDSEETKAITVENNPVPLKGSLLKVDGHDPSIELNSKFQLYRGETEETAILYLDEQNQPIIIETIPPGSVEFEIPLEEGRYWLKETDQPDGYIKINRFIGPIVVTIEDNGSFTAAMEEDLSQSKLWTVVQKDSQLDITVNNYKPVYPATGGVGSLLFAGIGFSIMGLALLLRKGNLKSKPKNA
ncbi:MAG: SpaA isopeptide-forming pilin-related protein [Gallicola sp.]|nr:SpaA isopeptide-forming pilin-related protein [Gallicola sp.]